MIHNHLRLPVPWGRAKLCRCFAHLAHDSVMKFNIGPLLWIVQPGKFSGIRFVPHFLTLCW